MTRPTSKVQEALIEALHKMASSPELNEAEAEWLKQFVMRMVTELSIVKENQEGEPEAPIAA
ncbi:MAG TPA: hypothetical protein VGR47_04845 [Terracidiphilus sp.]|nr:hypothetical protein [Terracidiphilus sp.]